MRKLCIAAVALLAFVGLEYMAYAQTPRTATLNWGATTKDVEGNTITGVTYKVYQGPKGSQKVEVRTGLTATSIAITSLPPGETCFQVSANAAGGEGALSNEGCKSFAIPAPAAPGALIVN